ncbi:unnamed protein product [Allacma fusca]|uniref:Uncharacterized protein n=1 Tax=Allacma fusca TaxID=39272 RepID=A0A8J2JT99_9HEXA|nr:unnamed protein product [Allacma fusca]
MSFDKLKSNLFSELDFDLIILLYQEKKTRVEYITAFLAFAEYMNIDPTSSAALADDLFTSITSSTTLLDLEKYMGKCTSKRVQASLVDDPYLNLDSFTSPSFASPLIRLT